MDRNDYTPEIQSRAFRILRVFQEICEKNDLLYYAIGGTCIGAVRHQGFIPWDDDIDVAMPYNDYCRFREICKKELPEPYSVIGPDNCKHYTMLYFKIHDGSTCYVESHDKNYKDRYCGVSMDVFPIFGLPSDENDIQRLRDINEVLKRKNIKRRFPLSEESGLPGRIYWLIRFPFKLFRPYNYYSQKQEETLGKNSFSESDKVFFPWRRKPEKNLKASYKDIFYYEDFKEAKKVVFEDGYINIPIGFDRYLKMDFGDYMKLPAKEKQVGNHPTALIDLSKSYKEYI